MCLGLRRLSWNAMSTLPWTTLEMEFSLHKTRKITLMETLRRTEAMWVE